MGAYAPLVDDAWQRLRIHTHRIRTTVEASRDRRSWLGSSRATIDPHRTQAVEGDHYLAGQSQAQKAATEDVIEDAQRDLVRRPHPQAVVVPTSHEDLVGFVRDFPQLARELKLHEEALAELLGGERDVTADAPGERLVGDITYIPTGGGRLYLATVIDCCTEEVIGYAMDDHYQTPLISRAIRNAARNRKLAKGAIFHSGRGSNYMSAEYGERPWGARTATVGRPDRDLF
ncbi:DDE-type integrase/transposase/recombinase [Streptomyces sp. NPDC002845]